VLSNIARLAAMVAAVILLSHTANADPRPGNPGNRPGGPWFQEELGNKYRKAVKINLELPKFHRQQGPVQQVHARGAHRQARQVIGSRPNQIASKFAAFKSSPLRVT
jgi:hypothetical protein